MEAIPGVKVTMTSDYVLRTIFRTTRIPDSPIQEAQFRIDEE